MAETRAETIARLLSDMDAEAMPNARRAEILVAMFAPLNDEDRAWAAGLAVTLPEMPEEPDV